MNNFFSRFGAFASAAVSPTAARGRASIAQAALIAGCAVLAPVSSVWASGTSQWDGAERWVGHQASESLSPHDGTFFDLPAVAETLPRMLTPAKRASFDSDQLTTKVERVDHYLVTSKCRSEDCTGDKATVILDMNSKNIWYVIRANDDQEVQRCWIGTARYQTLPPVLQASFTSD
jgi:hypothetical protein